MSASEMSLAIGSDRTRDASSSVRRRSPATGADGERGHPVQRRGEVGPHLDALAPAELEGRLADRRSRVRARTRTATPPRPLRAGARSPSARARRASAPPPCAWPSGPRRSRPGRRAPSPPATPRASRSARRPRPPSRPRSRSSSAAACGMPGRGRRWSRARPPRSANGFVAWNEKTSASPWRARRAPLLVRRAEAGGGVDQQRDARRRGGVLPRATHGEGRRRPERRGREHRADRRGPRAQRRLQRDRIEMPPVRFHVDEHRLQARPTARHRSWPRT